MKFKHLLLGLFSLLLIVAILTNPDKEKHTDFFFEKIIDKEKLANGTIFDFFALKIVKGTFEEITTYKNFVFFSICELSSNENKCNITIGLFGNVLLLADENDLVAMFNFDANQHTKKSKTKETTWSKRVPPKEPQKQYNEFNIDEPISILPNEKEIALPPVEDVKTNPSNKFPRYLISLEKYSPSINLICEDQGYSECLKYALEFAKVLSEIRKAHISKKEDSEYLKFYTTDKAVLSKRNWKKDAIVIDKYLYEYINLYEINMNDCGCEDLDWFKKLPKDLYSQFNLNRQGIMNNWIE